MVELTELPKKINPNPIVESILEIKFSSQLPEDAIFGLVYNQFRDEYPKFEQLPILQLPAAIRTQDPNLFYNPYYKAQENNFIFQVGPRTFSISNIRNYVGWEEFSKKIYSTYEKINNIGVIDKIERIGLRYINVLNELNIFDISDISISLKDEVIRKNTSIETEIFFEKVFCKLKVTSDAEITFDNSNDKTRGSVIDIDVAIDVKNFDTINSAIEYAHNKEKELFFKILKEQYIKKLSPEY